MADYEEMIARGILNGTDRAELIRGQILEKMTIGELHLACVNRLNWWLGRQIGDRAIISIQNPVVLSDSEPDVALLRPRTDFYASGKPTAADVLVLIEVADASLEFDRNVKGPLYAEGGITEFWIVNLVDGCVEVHRGPQADGRYADVRALRRGDTVEIAALAGCVLAVDQIL